MNPLKNISWFLFCISLVLTLSSGVASASGCGSLPSAQSSLTLYCIPITVAASSATSNAQVMLTLPASTYSTYLAGSLQNIYVYNSISGTTTPAWIEGNVLNEGQTTNLNTAANVIIWINDPNVNIISTSADTNYYIGIGSTSTNFFVSGNNIGEAPTLSSTYAQYDNGNVIFANGCYDNFYGTTFSGTACGGYTLSGSPAVNNGLQLLHSSDWIHTNNYYNPQVYANMFLGVAGSSFLIGYGPISQAPAYVISGSSGGCTTGSLYYVLCNINPGIGVVPIGTSSPTLQSLFNIWATSTASYASINFTNTVTNTGSFSASTSIQPGYVTYSGSIYITFIVERLLPPGGVMPSTTFGAVQILSSISLTISPAATVAYGTGSITATATCTPSSDTCAVQYPLGTNICSGTGTCTYNIPNYAAAGSYTYYANDLTSNNNVAGTLTVSQAPSLPSWTAQCANPFMLVYTTPNPCSTIGYLPSIANQLIGNLYLNNVLQTSTSASSNTATYELSTNDIGTYAFTFNTLGNGNYLANSITYSTEIYESAFGKNVLASGALATATLNPGNSPYTWGTFYPIQIYTSSPSNTLNYTLTQTIASVTTYLQTNVLNLSYIPPATQITGNYIYTITERQMGNSFTDTLIFAANTLNMTDINGPFQYGTSANTLCQYAIQYFPNCVIFPFIANTFTAKPSSWSIKSDKPINQFTNTSFNTNNLEQFTNANLTFNAITTLNYPFTSFIANVLNNPEMTNMITQMPFKFSSSSSVPYTRLIVSANTLDQQFLNLLNTNDTQIFQTTFNNYIQPANSSTFANVLGWNTFMGLSNYKNPSIYLFNISILSTAKNHYNTVNNFCSVLLANGASVTYKPYLANLNASLYTFQIYQGTGYGATNYTMVIQTGASPSSAIQVQSYKIAAVPFALPLENGQEYRFLFYNPNCTLAYTSPLSIWPQTITLYLPSNQSLGPFSNPQPNANCFTYSNTMREWVVCTGNDPTSIITGWAVNITQPSFLGSVPVQNYSFTGASFTLNWTVPNNTKEYLMAINDYMFKPSLKGNPLNYQVNQSKAPFSTGISIGIMSLFLFLVLVLSAVSDLRLAIVLGLVSMAFGAVAQLNLLIISAFVILMLIGLIIIFLIRNRMGE